MENTGCSSTIYRVIDDVAEGARLAAVIDTNYFIDNLPIIKALTAQALEFGIVVVVPWIVIQELDGLKSSNRINNDSGSLDIGTLARKATRFLEDELGCKGSALRCQKRSEYVLKEVENDNKILDCCLYFMEKKSLPVALLTRDRNLTVKARANGCATCSEWKGNVSGLIAALTDMAGLPVQAIASTAIDDDCMDIDMDEGPNSKQQHNSQAFARNIYGSAASPHCSFDQDISAISQVDSPPATPTTSKPAVIYIDELSQKEEAANFLLGQKAAHTISREIIQYMCNDKRCALSTLIVNRLEKDAMVSYKEGAVSMKRAFASPPWKSCTTLLTVIVYYWDVFQHVFPKKLKTNICEILPWVMHVEDVVECPQTQLKLPPYLHFEPYKYAVESDNVFENVRNQASERNAQTSNFIMLAKLLLAQCALVETDSQENYRQQITQRWITWQKINQ
ncbi:hypothetical protein LPJ78_005470 [Coemansia sp. RSA 989]|nr:PIN domain-containing protein [Coemansia mojavensis]KAJ1738767.1 hypothetical protein LPJ68_005270 [Coemansia sp. RSA 1086]KAJ1751029.1 hypothetical protein LPJ79_002439 [Coemansia sp. RSA 1821]KAJ1861209.1 hypothetical protein LPJ78_005470 [Coemansia sp. RSA 989]KAJ2675094.1 hypothetical protein IWW42_001240 [Coemansia sp. RSA 1085]